MFTSYLFYLSLHGIVTASRCCICGLQLASIGRYSLKAFLIFVNIVPCIYIIAAKKVVYDESWESCSIYMLVFLHPVQEIKDHQYFSRWQKGPHDADENMNAKMNLTLKMIGIVDPAMMMTNVYAVSQYYFMYAYKLNLHFSQCMVHWYQYLMCNKI